MTLCFFSAQYLPTVGGVERYTWNLARRVAAAGHRAVVVTSALPGLPARETSQEGIRIYRLPSWLWMRGRFPVVRAAARETRRLAAALWAERPDFCLIQTRFYPLSLWAAAAARRRRIPAIVVDHSTGHMPMGSPVLNGLAALYEHLACAFLRLQRPSFYGVSGAVCGWLRHFGITPAGALYNAIDPEEIARAIGRAAGPDGPGGPANGASAGRALPGGPAADGAGGPGGWRARLGLGPNGKLIAFAGRLIPEKGAAGLIRAYALLPKALRAKAALVVAGDGPMLPALRAGLPDGVHLAGSLPHDETLRLFAESDLYCLPTRYAEGFPTTLLEAAACGCAILCSDTAGSAELLPDERCGIRLPLAGLSPDEAAAALAGALERALTDDAWRAEAARRAMRRVTERFTWDAVAGQLLALAAGSPALQTAHRRHTP